MSGADRGVVRQRYLHPAPEGIDAFAAWRVGADGRGQALVDVERGWNPRHLDLAIHDVHLIYGTPLAACEGHGTSVLGIACAAEHGPDFEPPRAGCTGVAPRVARIDLVAIDEGGTNLVEALSVALDRPPGDVVLIEVQSRLPPPHDHLLAPVEAHPALYELIASAVDAGVVVIEVGGNGTTGDDDAGGLIPALDMDRLEVSIDGLPAPIFDRAYRDSGAIIVSAASDDPEPRRLPYAPHGERIDLYARAERVFCPTSERGERTRYRSTFSGTSAAGAIVAGAALCLQSHAMAKLGGPLDGRRMRDLLRRGGTPPASGEAPIGVMPNLAALLSGDLLSGDLLSGDPLASSDGAPST